MESNVRAKCLMHLREAALCLEGMGHGVMMVRVLDIVDDVEQVMATSEVDEIDS